MLTTTDHVFAYWFFRQQNMHWQLLCPSPHRVFYHLGLNDYKITHTSAILAYKST